ncbi:MarR family winged helix-turn-helix transcriptional regulator [Vibrio maerlii]|uniref:MarR family winged helix-turn-helix transcriptional regulator n=1 Tax=Vibrio maerlii TaxID=2231648 RepID=UPI000E3C4AB6|nr:MarR family transcriptional regulator [Vibrio maerlii]
MKLDNALEHIERFAAKHWRACSKEDVLAQLSFNEYDYLKVIQLANEPLRITDLASEMEVSKPSATNMVKRLVKKDLVATQPCPEDARSKRVKLTAYAEQCMTLELKIYQQMATQLRAKINKSELELLEEILAKALK